MRLRSLLGSTVVALVLALGSQERAQAAPIFTLPDLTFAALENGRTVSGQPPVEFNAANFQLGVSSATLGDSMALDKGMGFVPLCSTLLQSNSSGTVTSTGFRYGPGFTVQLGPGVMEGEGITSFVLVRTLVGYDGFGLIKVVASDEGSPWTLGQTLGLDVHIFNVHFVTSGEGESGSYFAGDVKGDLAPVIPEPATLGLLGLGLLGLATRARRRTKA